MVTLLIEHPISDAATWRSAFDRFADARERAGVLAHRILRPVGDPRYVVVELDFGTTAEAAAFRDFLRTRVWADPAASPALAGEPRAAILEPL